MTNTVTPILNPIQAQFCAARVLFSRAIVSDSDRQKILKAGFIAAALMITSPVSASFKPILSKTSSPPSLTPPLLPLFSASLVATQADDGNTHFLPKSFAQVETWVGPQVAPPMSCELTCLPKPRRRQELKRKRASPVKVRLNPDEKNEVIGKAQRAGMSLNAFIKQSILDASYDPHLRKALLALNRELTAQGNNLNQIAKHHNSGKITQIEGESMLAIMGRSYLQTHREIMKALARGKPEELAP